jgi:hypothetical protein
LTEAGRIEHNPFFSAFINDAGITAPQIAMHQRKQILRPLLSSGRNNLGITLSKSTGSIAAIASSSGLGPALSSRTLRM